MSPGESTRTSVALVIQFPCMSTPTKVEPKQKQKPQWHLKAGVLDVACWKVIAKGQDGTDREFFTVTLQRSFKDKEGAWQHSQSLRRQDLLPATRLLEQAYDKLLGTTSADEEA